MNKMLFPASTRGNKDQGWLRSNFVFSFSDYYAPTLGCFGTLMAFNDDYLAPGKGFGTHPHMNMEIISILLKGKMNHKDSMGYSTVIEEGGVQIMSAGSGLFHEEYNIGEDEVNFLQIWIQPKQQNIKPRYQTRTFDFSSTNQLTTIVSSEEGLKHCWINQNARLSIGHYIKGEAFTYRYTPTNKCLFVFVIHGTLSVSDEILYDRDAIGIWNSGEVQFAFPADCKFVIVETVVNQK
jgi:hypothetical protein